MLHTVIFMGQSGSGKGTQVALFNDRIRQLDPGKRQIMYVETGDSFRKFIKGENYSSLIAKERADKGRRQPDFLACMMWGNILTQELDRDMHIVFDGVARSLNEAKMLTTALEFYERKPTVIYIKVSDKWAEERLLGRGRADDRSIEKVHGRLHWFNTDVLPSIKYFKEEPFYRVLEINGEQTIEKVHQDIMQAYEQDNDKA